MSDAGVDSLLSDLMPAADAPTLVTRPAATFDTDARVAREDLVTQAYAPPEPTPGPAVPPSLVSCPECGTSASAMVNRRDAADFCRTCDYPLFWVPGQVTRDVGSVSRESLRRLPGTVGRASAASIPCPTCAEPNAVAALVCVRCDGPMVLAQAPPPPVAPRPLAPPPVAIQEAEDGVPWWVWLLVAVAVVGGVIAVIVVLA